MLKAELYVLILSRNSFDCCDWPFSNGSLIQLISTQPLLLEDFPLKFPNSNLQGMFLIIRQLQSGLKISDSSFQLYNLTLFITKHHSIIENFLSFHMVLGIDINSSSHQTLKLFFNEEESSGCFIIIDAFD